MPPTTPKPWLWVPMTLPYLTGGHRIFWISIVVRAAEGSENHRSKCSHHTLAKTQLSPLTEALISIVSALNPPHSASTSSLVSSAETVCEISNMRWETASAAAAGEGGQWDVSSNRLRSWERGIHPRSERRRSPDEYLRPSVEDCWPRALHLHQRTTCCNN